ncbi:MAG: twin-arginine translocase TatA/TatE family subunit, partial [Deltaproteobacteria bacterium]|nr:twin-arginine translocase TatA/TatE family subunit [Deltaproteobacteria bacterium]
GALGRGIRNFKKASREPNEIDVTPSEEKKSDDKKA